MGWSLRSSKPLGYAEIGCTCHSNFSGAPWLHANPLDGVVKVLAFLRRPNASVSARAADSAWVGDHENISMRAPDGWILAFEHRVRGQRLKKRRWDGRPSCVLAIGTPQHDRGQGHI